jgi:hypothetical protein
MGASALALGRRDGVSLDRLALSALRHRRSPHRLVPAPEGVLSVPEWVGAQRDEAPPASLYLPANRVLDDGVIDLGSDGAALLCRASTISFGLRTSAEQSALVAAFGRYLNSLGAPTQVVIRAEPVEISGSVHELRRRAIGLPHPGLERAALAHASFLIEQAQRHDLLRRQVLLVFADPTGGDGAGGRLRRRAEEAAGALATAGVTLESLDAASASRCVAAALAPFSPAPNATGYSAAITGGTS